MTSTAIARKLDAFCAWYKLTRGVRLLQTILFVGVLLMTGMILVNKLLWIDLDYFLVARTLSASALLILLAFHLASRRHATEVGYLVDRAAGLKNLVGSSLDAESEHSEVAQVVRDRAYASLSAQRPSTLIPLTLNWAGRYLYIPFALLIAVIMLPQLDLLQRSVAAAETEEESLITKKTAIRLQAAMKSVEETPTDPAESIDGKNIEKDFRLLPEKLSNASKDKALSEIGEFENKYARNFEKQRAFEKLAKSLEEPSDMTGIPLDTQKDLKRLAQGMQEGNFKDAAEAMRDLAKRLADKQTPPTEKQALARELKKLMDQMQGPDNQKDGGEKGEKNANPADKLADMLAGMQAQGADLEDLLKQAKAAGGDLEKMADMLEDMDAMQAMKDAMAGAKKDLLGDDAVPFDAKQMEEMMKREAEMAENAQGQPGQGQQPGQQQGQGQPGDPGQGGGTPEEIGNQTGFKDEKSNTKMGEGRILHQIFVKGVPEKGEAQADYQKVSSAARQEAVNSLAQDKIPREYEDMVKKYFDSLDLKNGTTSQE